MSKIIALVGAQNALNVQVKQSAAKLDFLFSSANPNLDTWAEIFTKLNAITLNVELQSTSGRNEVLISQMPLGIALEAYSSNEGLINVTVNGANTEVRASIELGTDGALILTNEQCLVININGMVANDNLDVYAVDFPIASAKAIKTTNIRFLNGAEQVIALANGAILHIPKASFTKIELNYPNGRVITLLPVELQSWLIEGNQIQGNLLGTVTYGFLDLYSLNVADAVSAKITMSADVNLYLFNHVAV